MRQILFILLVACNAEPPPPPPQVVVMHPVTPSATPSPLPELVLPAPSDPKARLKAPELAFEKELLPDPRLEWLVIGNGKFRRPALLGEFDEKWRREHDIARIYGWRGDQAVVVLDDDSESYDQVAVAIRLLTPAGDDDLRLVGASHLTLLRDELSARLKKAGAGDVKIPVSIEDAAAATKKLQALFTATSSEIQVRLLAPNGKSFPGPQVLDVLLSLGAPLGKDEVELAGFEVKTSTPPGKLEPRALVAGKINPTNLIFELYVPHAPRPVAGLELMLKAEAYAQKRLGGSSDIVIETFGKAAKSDVKTARKRVADVDKTLTAAGFPPGAPATLRLFWIP